MSTIPKHMQVNLTSTTPSEGLLRTILDLPWHKAKQGVCDNEYLEFDGLFVSIKWKRYPLARFLHRWECITVSVEDNDGYVLCIYDNFTRIYKPGEWENIIKREVA